jgi:hypothetical protein
MPSGAPAADPPTALAEAYCRAARRIRGQWSRRPGRLHRELRELARRQDRKIVAAPPPLGQRTCGTFASEVARRLEGPVLRHAERRKLIAAARRMGIGRFEANLVIAAVQHQRGSVDARQVAGPMRLRHLAPVALVMGLELAVAWGAWVIFHG